jgi:diguanylate cyclase (GGDEF)-like protein
VTDDEWDDEDDFDPALDATGVIDLSDVRAKLKADRKVRDRHILVRMNGSFVGRVYPLETITQRVGRAPSAELWIDEPGISRRHARIEPVDDGFEVIDERSANGTFVFGERIARHRLQDGELVQFGATAVYRYSVTDSEHEKMLVNLYEASVRDPLTGIFNRDHFGERLRAELAFARRHQTEVSLVMFDIDHFKRINDTHGHQAGDRVLISLARAIADSVRIEDVLARYGGEEFVLILRNIDLEGAAAVAERLRRVVAALSVHHEGREIQVTASFGCASLTTCAEPDGQALIAAADVRLYEAKGAGRNRVAF